MYSSLYKSISDTSLNLKGIMSSASADIPLKSPLQTHFEKVKKLYDEDDGPKKHQSEISDILLWIATNHPGALQEGSEQLYNLDYIKVRRLYFRESWVNPEEPLPTDAMVTLLNSDICGELKTFCGYVNPAVLENFKQTEQLVMRLALTKHINVQLLLRKLKERRLKQYKDDDFMFEDELSVHLRSRELDPKDLATLPDIKPTVYITDVKDEDADWVVQAAVALKPKINSAVYIDPEMQPEDQESYPYIESLYLPHSELTAAGIEAIAKGLFEAKLTNEQLSTFEVSSSHFVDDDGEIPGYEDEEDFCEKISEKYQIEEFNLTIDNSMEFKDYATYICEEEDSWEDNKYEQGWGRCGTTLQGGY